MASIYRRQGTSGRYRVKFRDPGHIWRDVLGYTDAKASKEMGRKLEQIAAIRAAGETPDPELSRFVRGLPENLQAKLMRWGMLDSIAIAGARPLTAHLAEYKQALLDGVASNRQKGPATHYHAKTVASRIERLLKGIGATHITDVRAEAVGQYLTELRTLGESITNKDGGTKRRRPLSVQSSNHWLQNAQSFLAWLVRSKRTTSNPLHGIAKIQVTDGKRKIRRRPLEHDEATKLLTATLDGPERRGVSAEERYWLYRLALETGLRSSELRTLKRENCNLDQSDPFVWLVGDDTKNSKPADLPLRPATAELLQDYLAGKHPHATLFPNMPTRSDVSDMLRDDLAVAGIQFEIDGRRVDFHALRTTCLSWLANAGTPLKVLQDFARHSDPKLTMKHYARTMQGSLAGAAARLPNLDRSAIDMALATGTDDIAASQTTPRTTPNGTQNRASVCSDVHPRGVVLDVEPATRKDYKRRVIRRKQARQDELRPAGLEPATSGLGNRMCVFKSIRPKHLWALFSTKNRMSTECTLTVE